MDGSSDFPSRPEMEANLTAFAERAGHRDPLRLPLGVDPPRGDRRRRSLHPRRRPTASTAAGYAIFAVGVAEPYTPPTPGHRARGPLRGHARGRDVRGQAPVHHRQAELRLRARDRACSSGRAGSRLSSPSPAKTSIETRSLVGVRARYVQPFEDSILGGGVDILAAEHQGHQPRAVRARLRVDARAQRQRACRCSVEADEVIAATGFICPLLDLPALGVATFGQSKLPGPDGLLGERDRARHLLRRHDRPGLRRASRSTASRPTPAPSTAPATTPASSSASSPRRHFGIEIERPGDRARRPPRLPPRRGDLRARAVAPEGVPRRASSALDPDDGHPRRRASCR